MTEEELEISTLRQKLAKLTDILEAERAIKRIPKNLDFVQVSRPELRAIAELGKKNSVALDVLMIFVQTMDKQNAVMMSFKAMESILGKSRPTLDRAIRILKKDKWIQVIKVGTANAYVLNKEVFWTSSGDSKILASFSAQVVTTLDEQDKDLRKSKSVKLKKIPILTSD